MTKKLPTLIAAILRYFLGQSTLDTIKAVRQFGLSGYRQKIRYIRESEIKFNDKKSHFLSLCAILKDEAPYLKEWVWYHKLAGVDKFYLYDNGSTDKSASYIQELARQGINIDYTWFPGEKMQLPAYQHCLKKAIFETRWLTFIDLDEFLFCPGSRSLIDILNEDTKKVQQLSAHWMMFGSNGHIQAPDGLVIENYVRHSRKVNPLTKSIVNPRRVFSVGVHRSTICGRTCFLPVSILRINHYHFKSLEEYERRAIKGDVAFGKENGPLKYNRQRFNLYDKNEVFDDSACKYANEIRLRINRCRPGNMTSVPPGKR